MIGEIQPRDRIEQRALRHDEAEAYVMSCANIRVAPIIAELEEKLEAPVVTSNQAMLWHCLRTGGLGQAVHGYGALLERH